MTKNESPRGKKEGIGRGKNQRMVVYEVRLRVETRRGRGEGEAKEILPLSPLI